MKRKEKTLVDLLHQQSLYIVYTNNQLITINFY